MWIIYNLASKAIALYEIAIFIRVIASWIDFSPGNKFIGFIYEITDPYLNGIRDVLYNKLNLSTGMFDISPIIALIILRFISDLIFRTSIRF